ncbi:MAG: 50S ribosomal protein L17 [Prevotella sp.]|jgi:large subunit ribosomal protein L17
MRHNKKFNHLGRTASHRASMLSNMASSLIMHKRITTTLAKAKALKKYVEPLITRAKHDTTTSRRVVFRYLQDKYAVKELFGEVANRVGDRPGGYTRVIKLGTRKGDAAEIAFIELVDFDENMAKTPKAEKKTRRSRRSKKSSSATAENKVAEATEEAVKTEAKESAKEVDSEKAVKSEAKKAAKPEAKKAAKAEKTPKAEKAAKAKTAETEETKADKAE